MKKYFLGNTRYYHNLGRQEQTFIQPKRKLKENEIVLYNKNTNTYSYWQIIGKPLNFDGMILERGSCPNYWRGVIPEITKSPDFTKIISVLVVLSSTR